MIRDFKKAGNPLDRICKEKLGCGVQEIFISYKDHFELAILINTYKTQYCLLGVSRLEAAYQMEKTSLKSTRADREKANSQDDSVDFDPELADLYPDLDEVPDGYFVNEFGELESGMTRIKTRIMWTAMHGKRSSRNLRMTLCIFITTGKFLRMKSKLWKTLAASQVSEAEKHCNPIEQLL